MGKGTLRTTVGAVTMMDLYGGDDVDDDHLKELKEEVEVLEAKQIDGRVDWAESDRLQAQADERAAELNALLESDDFFSRAMATGAGLYSAES